MKTFKYEIHENDSNYKRCVNIIGKVDTIFTVGFTEVEDSNAKKHLRKEENMGLGDVLPTSLDKIIYDDREELIFSQTFKNPHIPEENWATYSIHSIPNKKMFILSLGLYYEWEIKNWKETEYTSEEEKESYILDLLKNSVKTYKNIRYIGMI